jgi:hypothetical protein
MNEATLLSRVKKDQLFWLYMQARPSPNTHAQRVVLRTLEGDKKKFLERALQRER